MSNKMNAALTENVTPLPIEFAPYNDWSVELTRWFKSRYTHPIREIVDHVIDVLTKDGGLNDKQIADVAYRTLIFRWVIMGVFRWGDFSWSNWSKMVVCCFIRLFKGRPRLTISRLRVKYEISTTRPRLN